MLHCPVLSTYGLLLLVFVIRQTLRPVISASQILTRSWLRVRNCDLRSSWFGERDIPDFHFLRVGTSYFAWVARKRGGSLTTWKTDKQLLKRSWEETVKSSERKNSMGVCPHRTEMCTFTHVNRSSRDFVMTLVLSLKTTVPLDTVPTAPERQNRQNQHIPALKTLQEFIKAWNC